MELRQLQYLARIARVGGFRRAADELDMSQATLSEQIKLLEHELGVRLFERGSRTLTLTEPGRVLLERAERILEEVKTAQEEMLEFAHLNRGQLIFGTMTGVGSVWLPGFIAASGIHQIDRVFLVVERDHSIGKHQAGVRVR